MVKYCPNCGIKFQRRSTARNDKIRFCSRKCAAQSRCNTSTGEIKVENEDGKILHSSHFKGQKELKDLIDLFGTAPVLIVKFD